MTPCECPVAGYCGRHRITKIGRLHELCQTDERYYDRWETTIHERKERPLAVAYNHWMPLHYYPVKHWDDWNEAAAKRWYRIWKRAIPKTGCGCAENWKKEVAKYPPNFKSAEAFFQWTWLVHDAVNERLGKPRVSLAECYGIWMPV